MKREKIWTRNYIVVCMSSFFMFLTFYILATAFPLYVKEGLHGDQQQMGLVITVYVIGGVLLRPFSGGWVDRYGQKKMAIVGMVVFLAACISYFGTKNGILLFLVARLIHGMAYALASTATSTVAASIIPASRQGEGMGYFSMFMSIGMVVGPAMGLFLWKDKNVNVLLLAICIIAAISLAFTIAMKVPERKRNAELQPAPEKKRKGFHWSDIVEPSALPISFVGFILSFSYSSLSGFMSSFTSEINESKVTSSFFVAFAVMIVAFRPMIGKVFDRYKEHYLYYPGIFLFSVGMLMLSQAHSGTMVLVDGVIMGIGYGALLPCLQALAMKLAPEHRRGSATGTFFLMFDLGYGIGSYIMGLIASYTDYRMMYVVAGIVPIASVVGYYLLHHRKQFKLAAAHKQHVKATA
ncbi:MFS transporter [Paenibacillus rhizovicinus]|uniref:MFS transporter n=1 Tax=Paenibacillus rhizovicinus TaxID=2704463 RepID=A0A6C0P2Q6_9BACL|nr:MFS transporter [Paenibacillus rhizovicinus]QHW32735.1 MFS transporter [Paenibacillus rhizovicinus]